MRINRFIARAGAASRRGADALISAGRVRLNGETVTKLATTVDPKRDRVELDGVIVTLPESLTYLALNKPPGYVVTMSDPQGRPTVADLLAGVPAGVVPVGRLDAATEGLLILTDDGEMAHRIAHPSFEIDKVYEVVAAGSLSENERVRLEEGVVLEGRRTSPATVRVLRTEEESTFAEVTIHEGRKRQVRRMFELMGHPVTSLRRTRVGPVELEDLKSGEWRHLDAAQLRALRDALDMPPE
ncbi:MAG TPA: pseudouridine synthase [bacterium]|nr:pseudouridine synthase [bacterium]